MAELESQDGFIEGYSARKARLQREKDDRSLERLNGRAFLKALNEALEADRNGEEASLRGSWVVEKVKEWDFRLGPDGSIK